MNEPPVYLPDYMSVSAPVVWHEEPAEVIVLPLLRTGWKRRPEPKDDGLPSDVEP